MPAERYGKSVPAASTSSVATKSDDAANADPRSAARAIRSTARSSAASETTGIAKSHGDEARRARRTSRRSTRDVKRETTHQSRRSRQCRAGFAGAPSMRSAERPAPCCASAATAKTPDQQRVRIEQEARTCPESSRRASSGTPRSRLPSATPKSKISSALESENAASQNWCQRLRLEMIAQLHRDAAKHQQPQHDDERQIESRERRRVGLSERARRARRRPRSATLRCRSKTGRCSPSTAARSRVAARDERRDRGDAEVVTVEQHVRP